MKERFEKSQVLLCLGAILLGLLIGMWAPQGSAGFEVLLWPTLGVLLYAVFTQVPTRGMGALLLDDRFFAALITGNFLVLPLVAWGLVHLLPEVPAVRLLVLMVLLVPCTDRFITFTQLGGGATRRAVHFTPVSLLLQMALLPLYLWLFLGGEFVVQLAGCSPCSSRQRCRARNDFRSSMCICTCWRRTPRVPPLWACALRSNPFRRGIRSYLSAAASWDS